MNEKWVDIKGYEGLYEISNLGNVRSKDRHVVFTDKRGCEIRRNYPSKILSQHRMKDGYMRVELSKDGKSKKFLVHRLVAINFLDNKNNLKEVNHIDAQKNNNCVENLEWVTRKRNVNHAFDLGLIKREKGSLLYNSKFTEEDIKIIRKKFNDGVMDVNELAKVYGVNRKTMFSICAYESWKHVT